MVQSKHAPAGRNDHQHNGANAQRASQTPQLSLTFPKSPAHHHRAAVQSNEVYPTPPASARRVSFGRASDKRFPLWRAIHNGQEPNFASGGCSSSMRRLIRFYKTGSTWSARGVRRRVCYAPRRAAPCLEQRRNSLLRENLVEVLQKLGGRRLLHFLGLRQRCGCGVLSPPCDAGTPSMGSWVGRGRRAKRARLSAGQGD